MLELTPETAERAADTLRGWALDEDLKARVLAESGVQQGGVRPARVTGVA